MGDFPLFKFDGKALEKLIDVISKAIGKIYEPKAIRNEADARAYEILVTEKAKAEVYAYKQGIEQDVLDRICERTIHREFRKQKNIDRITMVAIEELKNESSVSSTPVDEDWADRFFNIVENVSDEQMQRLWGKILAGEVKSPNSFSIRTIDFLKNMTKVESELFTKAANYIITSDNGQFLFKGTKNEILEKHGFSYDDRQILTEIGLIRSGERTALIFDPNPENRETFYRCGKHIIKCKIKAGTPMCDIPVFMLTTIGKELLKMLSITYIESYVRDFYYHLYNMGLEVEYAFILNIDGDLIEHTTPWMKY